MLGCFNLSSITASFPWTESTGHGSTELAPTRRKQIANVDVNNDSVTLFLSVALTNISYIRYNLNILLNWIDFFFCPFGYSLCYL